MTTTLPRADGVAAEPRSSTRSPSIGRRLRELVRGPEADARWTRPALLVLLAGTGVLYLWNLAASGWANAFYAAAAQAGSESWEAFFYGSSDAANSITVDKPPASLWVMALSVRLFGLSSWSILVPQALMGVATVGLLYLAVRRVSGPGAGLLAGLAMALTPVATLMFRFDNPDALLVLLMVAAAYALTRAQEQASTRWLLATGALVGLAFLTKTLQAMLVVPGFGLAYLIAAPTSFLRRVRQLLGALAALVGTAGWWIAVVELVPASDRPYVGGSQTNSVWELIWGYNGLGRLTGDETGSVGGGGGRGWGQAGLGRLFGSEIGGQVAWLLPAALVLLVVGLVVLGRAPRTDPRRAALISWGAWLLVTGATFSLMAGIFHAYYTVALAPAIAALVGIAGGLLWQRRRSLWARALLALVLVGTAVWAQVLLDRSADFLPWLGPVVVVGGTVAALGLLVGPWLHRVVVVTALGIGIVAGLAGPAAYAVETAGTPHSGSIPSAGPTVSAGGVGGFGGGAFGGLITGGRPGATGTPGGGAQGRSAGGATGGGPTGGGSLGGTQGGGPTGGGPSGIGQGGAGQGGTGQGTGGLGPGSSRGGLLTAADVSDELAAVLTQNADDYTWVAAAVGSNQAAGYQLATEQPVMPVGGFNGSDPSPTLAEFQQYVADGRIHWFIGGDGLISATGSREASQIAAWVEATFSATNVDGVVLYDLTRENG